MNFCKVYDILVQHAGAPEHNRASFLNYYKLPPEPSEWFFGGLLGLRGTFHYYESLNLPPHVSFSYEDRTPERERIRDKVNQLLQDLYLDFLSQSE